MATNIARSFARFIALPIVSAGVLGGAALGLAGMANAASYFQTGCAGTTQVHCAPDQGTACGGCGGTVQCDGRCSRIQASMRAPDVNRYRA